MKAKAIVSIERVRELLAYDQETGAITWRIRPARSHIHVGDEAGGVKADGYRAIGIDRKQVKAHRVAWLLTYGAWPTRPLDHINRVRDDNRIANLRECVGGVENNHNRSMSRNNTSGYAGVSWDETRRKWRAGIRSGGKSITIGHFATAELASAAYQVAKAKLHSAQSGMAKVAVAN